MRIRPIRDGEFGRWLEMRQALFDDCELENRLSHAAHLARASRRGCG